MGSVSLLLLTLLMLMKTMESVERQQRTLIMLVNNPIDTKAHCFSRSFFFKLAITNPCHVLNTVPNPLLFIVSDNPTIVCPSRIGQSVVRLVLNNNNNSVVVTVLYKQNKKIAIALSEKVNLFSLLLTAIINSNHKLDLDSTGIPMCWLFFLIFGSLIGAFVLYVYLDNGSQKIGSKPSKSPSDSSNCQSPVDNSIIRDQPISSKDFVHHLIRLGETAVNYLETVEQRYVSSDVKPGYLFREFPKNIPDKGENFDDILHDFDKYILPGLTHWQHPQFHAYFPAGNSYPSILGDFLANAVGCNGFTWVASPVYTELEMLVLDWTGRMIGLPEKFLFSGLGSVGGGAFMISASEAIFIAMVTARHAKIEEKIGPKSDCEEYLKERTKLLGKLVAYCSKEAHSSVEKASCLSMVRIHKLDVDDNFSMQGLPLHRQIEVRDEKSCVLIDDLILFLMDKKRGLIPFFVVGTLGTTSICSFDHLDEIGPICHREGLWLHVDEAYAGSSFICPELRYLTNGINYANSVNMNAHKWLLSSSDCSMFWTSDRNKLTSSLVVNPIYLSHEFEEDVIDYRNWGISLTRRFRALKLWFVLRMYGVEGIRTYIRRHINMATNLATFVNSDNRLELIGEQKLGLFTFRIKGDDERGTMTRALLTMLNATREMLATLATPKGISVIRICINHERPLDSDVRKSWRIIRGVVNRFFYESSQNVETLRQASCSLPPPHMLNDSSSSTSHIP